jgi:hypothetical protein
VPGAASAPCSATGPLEPEYRRTPDRLGDGPPTRRQAGIAREICDRLYTLCERKKRAAEAMSYNALVLSWPEILRLAQEGSQRLAAEQGGLFADEQA